MRDGQDEKILPTALLPRSVRRLGYKVPAHSLMRDVLDIVHCSLAASTFLFPAPDTRAGGGAPEMESHLSTLATCGFGVRTSLEAINRLSCPRSDTALNP